MGLVLIAGAILAATSWWRPIDGDEGYYAAAAGLVADGLVPYDDFFYPQAPLLPWIYAPIVKVTGHDLRALRFMSAGLALLTVLIWWRWLASKWGSRPGLVLLGLGLIALNPHQVSWAVTVKTYAVTGFLATVALVTLELGLRDDSQRFWLLLSGLTLGLAGATRLLFVPVGPALLLGLWVWPGSAGRRSAWPGILWFLGGWLLGIVPLLAAWIGYPTEAWFDNVGYHQLRYSALRLQDSGSGTLPRLWIAIRDTLAIILKNPYLGGLLVLAGFGIKKTRSMSVEDSRFYRLSALFALVYWVASMAPDPLHAQYFTAPFAVLLIPLATLGLEGICGRDKGALRRAGIVVLVAGPLVWFLQRPGISHDHVWSHEVYQQVVTDIETYSQVGETVFSFWPGYVFGADRKYQPGMENHFAMGVTEKITAGEKARFEIPDRRLLESAFRAQRPKLVVTGAWMFEVHSALTGPQLNQLVASFREEYSLVARTGEVRVYLRNKDFPPARSASP